VASSKVGGGDSARTELDSTTLILEEEQGVRKYGWKKSEAIKTRSLGREGTHLKVKGSPISISVFPILTDSLHLSSCIPWMAGALRLDKRTLAVAPTFNGTQRNLLLSSVTTSPGSTLRSFTLEDKVAVDSDSS